MYKRIIFTSVCLRIFKYCFVNAIAIFCVNMIFYIKILIILIIFQTISCLLDCNIILEYSKRKLVTKGAIFVCFNQLEIINLSKCLMENRLQFLIYNLIPSTNPYEGLNKLYNHWGVIIDGDCENVDVVIDQKINKKYYYETYHWLISSSTLNITNKLKKLKLNINCDMNLVVHKPENNETNINHPIYDVYNPAYEHGGQMKLEVLGFYNTNEGYVLTNFENKYWRRRNMTGVTFRSAIVVPVLNKPLGEYLASDENRQIDSMHRFQANTVQNCRDFYNFSLKIERTDSWGYIQSNGRFDGLVSLLERRQVDFGSSPLLFKFDRLPYVDYGYGNWILRSTFIYRKPKVISNSYEIFLRPLKTEVWALIFVTLCIILVVLRIVFWNEVHMFRKRNVNFNDTSVSFLVLFTLGAFCQQSAACYPKLLSSRILTFFIFLFAILIYQFYSASIVSYLLLDPPRTIFTLKDLKDSPLRVGVEDILIDRNYFVQTTDPDAIELFKTKIKRSNNNSGFYTPKDGLDLVRKGGFAFHVATSTAYPIIEESFSNQDICELEDVQMYRTQPMFTNLQKHSPFKEMLNYCMFIQAENGNMDRLRKHWDARQPTCIQSAKKHSFNVSLKEFSCGPIVVLLGLIFSLIFLNVEFFNRNKYAFVKQIKTSFRKIKRFFKKNK